MPTRRLTAQPQGTLVPYTGGINPPSTTRAVVGGLVDAFARIFATVTPPVLYDTDREVRMAAQASVSWETGGTAWQYLMERLTLAQRRKNLFDEYDDIEDNFPEISGGLDLYRDNVTSVDSISDEIVTIATDDEEVGALFSVMKQILKLDHRLPPMARELARTGEIFDEIVYDAGGFLNRLKMLPTAYMQRNEDEFGTLPFDKAFSQYNESWQVDIDFHEFQICHFRLLRRPDDIYGTGLLYSLRRLAKKLSVIEDALIITRLTRAHKRTVYGIPVDGMSPNDRDRYINDIKRRYRKRRVVNPRTGKLDLEQNPLAAEDDIFIGHYEKSKVEVEELGGDPSLGELRDYEMWQNKIFAAMQIPKAYLGLERDVNAKATLTEQDVQFARTVHRLQVALAEGIRIIFDRALVLFGRDPMTVQYDISFPAISLIDELRNWEIENTKLAAATQFAGLFRPDDIWLLTQYLGYSANDAAELIAHQVELPPEEEAEPGSESETKQALEWFEREKHRIKLIEKIATLHRIGKRKEKREQYVERSGDYFALAAELGRRRGALSKIIRNGGGTR